MNEVKRVLLHIRWRLQSFTLLGFLFGAVVSRANFSVNLVFGFISWLFLCSGISVFNSYYDKDKGPVAGLESPPAATSSLLVGAWILKSVGFIIALFFRGLFLKLYVVGVILSVLYSHKDFRFKSNGYVAVLINFIIGVVTFLAVSSFSSPSASILWFGGITSGVFLAAVYLMMQIHQKSEDALRQDISIMVLYGRKTTLVSAICLMGIAAILSFVTFVLSGFGWLYILVLAIYFAVVLFFSFVWLSKQEESISDFRIMNVLTMRLSYFANLILAIIYVVDVVFTLF